MRIGFIGLGAMGWHMAGHLVQLEAEIMVWNRTFAKAEQHAQQFGSKAVPLEEFMQADFIFSCLPTSADVEAFLTDHLPKQGCIWIDCTSGVPAAARRLSAVLAQQGVHYLDAPVSGQTVGAKNATLTVMVGGDAQAFTQARPVIQAFAGRIEYLGDSGSGFAVKAVNNVLMASNLWVLAEGLSVLKAHGVNLHAALQCINHASGKSSMSEQIMAQKVLSRRFDKTFALNLLQKDIGIALELIAQAGLDAQVLSCVQDQYVQTTKEQAARIDFSAALQNLEQRNQCVLN